MSESIRKLNENPVTALADTDYIVACDASGALSPITKADFTAAIRTDVGGGGRNLVKSTPTQLGGNMINHGDYLSLSAFRDAFFRVVAATDLRPLIGKPMTFSMECSGIKEGSKIYFGVGSQNINRVRLRNGRCSVTFYGSEITCPDKGNVILIDDHTIDVNGMNPSDIRLSHFMLESGTVAHDWSLAPEEVLERLTALEQRGGG